MVAIPAISCIIAPVVNLMDITENNTKEKSAAKASAVIESGGKQYLVKVGDVIDLELLGDHKEGDDLEFEQVLMSDSGQDTTIGNPYIEGAKVKATFVGNVKGKKLSIIRFKAKSNRSRKLGHRQKYSQVRINSLT